MSGKLAILSGGGDLPKLLAEARPDAYCVAFEGVESGLSRIDARHRFEAFGGFLDDLRAQGVSEVILAGGMARPPLNPAQFDPFMTALAPRLMAALQGGDDALLRLVIGVFEDAGFAVLGAHEVLPGLTAEPGLLCGPEPSARDRDDIDRATDILLALSPLDVGQGAVVAGGLVLGIETLQGTNAMLGFVAATPISLRGKGGVLVKLPKQGQDLRVDMPAIGPETIVQAAQAGLSGVVIEAGAVVVLDRVALVAEADRAGLFVLAVED